MHKRLEPAEKARRLAVRVEAARVRDAQRAEERRIRDAERLKAKPEPKRLYQKAPDGPAIIPAHVVIQTLPGFTGFHRYLVTGPVIGGFATLGVGRYL